MKSNKPEITKCKTREIGKWTLPSGRTLTVFMPEMPLDWTPNAMTVIVPSFQCAPTPKEQTFTDAELDYYMLEIQPEVMRIIARLYEMKKGDTAIVDRDGNIHEIF